MLDFLFTASHKLSNVFDVRAGIVPVLHQDAIDLYFMSAITYSSDNHISGSSSAISTPVGILRLCPFRLEHMTSIDRSDLREPSYILHPHETPDSSTTSYKRVVILCVVQCDGSEPPPQIFPVGSRVALVASLEREKFPQAGWLASSKRKTNRTLLS